MRRHWSFGIRFPRHPAVPLSARVTSFLEWQGSFFVGGLAGKTLWRLVPNASGTAIVGVEPLFACLHEIRDLKQGTDGWLYMMSRNNNQILRIER